MSDQNHPPSARQRICVDFDATLYPFGDLFGYPDPIPGAREALQGFRKKGYKIYIFTSRMSPQWWMDEGWDESAGVKQMKYIKSILDRDEIPFDFITGEKIAAIHYIDDKAIEFTGNNWGQISERVTAI